MEGYGRDPPKNGEHADEKWMEQKNAKSTFRQMGQKLPATVVGDGLVQVGFGEYEDGSGKEKDVWRHVSLEIYHGYTAGF
jgi:hypothetical protein